MWGLRSVAFQTDLFIVAAGGGDVIDRGPYVVARTPSNPDYWWGNLLVWREPPDELAPRRGHAGSWLDAHARELPHATATLLAWDRPDGATGAESAMAAFASEGFELDESAILTATARDLVKPAKWSGDVAVAPLSTDEHWRDAARAHVNAFAPRRSGSLDDLRTFVERQLAIYRRMQDDGVGRWWGAFMGGADGALAGSLGLVRVGDAPGSARLGRFQLVGIDPAFGRRGACSTLVYEVARRALEDEGLETLVMAADATYHAARVYESVGFVTRERLVALVKKPARA